MLRRLASTLTIIFLVFISLFFVPKVFAAPPAEPSPTPEDSVELLLELDNKVSDNPFNKNLEDFCKKRTGNQMNLETWYSGKCTDDTFSGEGVGFSDIVILDLAEKLSGKSDPGNSFSSTLLKVFKNLDEQTYDTPEKQEIAFNYVRQELVYGNSTGLISQSGKIIGLLFQNPPASTNSYLAHVTQNLAKHKVIPSAIAADSANGAGFDTFSPFLGIWMVMRNLAYLGLVVFFVVYGFMMMFRINLGQKTVISVQLAIPKLIVTLLVITFSYAIVGLVFDLMWVLIYFALSYLASQGLIVFGPTWHPAVTASGAGFFGLFGSLILNAVISGPAAIFGVLNLVLGGLGAAAGTIAGYFGMINFIVGLFVMIAVLISYGKLFFKLITAFVSVIISLVIAPLMLLGNAFPGSGTIGNWLRNIVANLAVFPVTMILLLFSYLLMIQPLVGICTNTTNNGLTLVNDVLNKIGVPNIDIVGMGPCEKLFGVKSLVGSNVAITGIPLITPTSLTFGDNNNNIINGIDARGLLALVGVGLLLMSAKYVEMVKDALKVPAFKYGSAISDALTQSRGFVSDARKGIQQISTTRTAGGQPGGSNTSQTQISTTRTAGGQPGGSNTSQTVSTNRQTVTNPNPASSTAQTAGTPPPIH